MPEACNGLDDDCDGESDEGLYPDLDGDGFGDASSSAEACFVGWVPNAEDCDDSRAEAFPGAVEICDGLPQECVNGRWDPASEAGMVRFLPDGGAEDPDVGTYWERGTASTPALVNLTTDGIFHVCPRSADPADAWLVSLSADAAGHWTVIGHPRVASVGAAAPEARNAYPLVAMTQPTRPVITVTHPEARLELRDLALRGQSAAQDSVVRVSDGYVDLTGVLIYDHSLQLTATGGAVRVSGGLLTLHDSAITDNYAGWDGAGLAVLGGRVEADGVTMENNSTPHSGGAIVVDSGGALVMTNSRIGYAFGTSTAGRGNLGAAGGGLIVATGGTADIVDTRIAGNLSKNEGATDGGGGIVVQGIVTLRCSEWVTACSADSVGVCGNEAQTDLGGGILVREGGDLSVDGCPVQENTPNDIWATGVVDPTTLDERYHCTDAGCEVSP